MLTYSSGVVNQNPKKDWKKFIWKLAQDNVSLSIFRRKTPGKSWNLRRKTDFTKEKEKIVRHYGGG